MPIKRKQTLRYKSSKSKSKSGCCVMKRTKKYLTRPGPPYPANTPCCRNTMRKGNNGMWYHSTKNSRGIYTWKKVVK